MKVGLTCLLSLFLLAPAVAGGRGPIDVRVRPAFAQAPAEVIVMVFVEPAADPRELTVAAESPEYFRASTVSLDGAASSRSHRFAWHAFPPGVYEITARVRDAYGRHFYSRTRLEVLP